jgi:hypothetical protein
MASIFETKMVLTWSEQKVRAWSNKGKTASGLPIDSIVVDHFGTLVEGEFESVGRTTLDLTKSTHLAAAMARGGYLLKRFGGEPGLPQDEDSRTLSAIENIRNIEQSDTMDPAAQIMNDVPFGKEETSLWSNSKLSNTIGVPDRFTQSGFFDEE